MAWTEPAAAPLLDQGLMLLPGGSPASGIFNISKKKKKIKLKKKKGDRS